MLPKDQVTQLSYAHGQAQHGLKQLYYLPDTIFSDTHPHPLTLINADEQKRAPCICINVDGVHIREGPRFHFLHYHCDC